MPGVGTIVNAVAVVAGTALGVWSGKLIPERIRKTAMAAIGLAVIGLGLQMALDPRIDPARFHHSGPLPFHPNPLVIIGGLVVGSLLGELLRIERRLESLGYWVQTLVAGRTALEPAPGEERKPPFAEGFVTASLVYCVGAMAVIGAIQDAAGQPQVLYVKAMLDGIGSIMLASALGPGVGFSALSLLLYQGCITLGAGLVTPYLTLPVLATLTSAGGLLIAAIGFDLAGFKRLPVGNMLPGVFTAAILAYFVG